MASETYCAYCACPAKWPHAGFAQIDYCVALCSDDCATSWIACQALSGASIYEHLGGWVTALNGKDRVTGVRVWQHECGECTP